MRKDYGRQRIAVLERPEAATPPVRQVRQPPQPAASSPLRVRRGFAPSAFAAAATVGALFAAASWLPAGLPSAAVPLVGAAFAATLAVTAAAGLVAARGTGAALRRAVPLPLFAGASFLQLLLIGSSSGRFAVAGLAVIVTGAYVAALRGIAEGNGRVSAADLPNLVFAMQAMTAFYLFSFMSGIDAFAHLPVAASAAIAGVAAVILVREALWHAGAPEAARPPVLAAVGLLVAELHAALELLPTDAVVNATVTVVLGVALVHGLRRAASAAAAPRALRRPLAFAFCLVIAVLFTARWA
jgi:hypothetical protein